MNDMTVAWPAGELARVPYAIYTDEAIYRRILDRYGHPSRPVGGPARYSNVGYLVLAEVISAAAGEPFEDHVRRVLLQPAGMQATGYGPPETADRATGHVRLPRGLGPVLRAALPPGIVGSRTGEFVAFRPFRVVGNLPFAGANAVLRRLLHPSVPLERADVIVELGCARGWVSDTRWLGRHDLWVAARVPRTSFAPAPSRDAAVLVVRRR